MSSYSAGQRVAASWLGGAFEPATVLEVSAGGAMLRVRFDDGRETWLAPMNARALPGAPAASAGPSMPPPPSAGFSPIVPGGSTPQPPAPVALPPSPPPVASKPFTPVANPAQPAQSAPQMPPAAPLTNASPDPLAPTQSLPATPANPAAPEQPPPSFGEFRPVQGAPIDGAAGQMPAGFDPFEPPTGGNKS